VPMLLAWPIAMIAAAGCGAAMALITARLRGDYLAIVTLGFSEVIRLVASNEIWLTNGTDGISAIPGPGRGVLQPVLFNLQFVLIVWVVVGLAAWLLARLSAAPFGRVLRAIREDEVIASVAGKRVLAFKVQAFAIGAGLMGAAGVLYAHFNAYIAPESFQPLVTIYVVLALTAGGTGTVRGAVLGAVLVVALTEGTRFLGGVVPGLAPVQVAALREASIGVVLILVLTYRPGGIIPETSRIHRLEMP